MDTKKLSIANELSQLLEAVLKINKPDEKTAIINILREYDEHKSDYYIKQFMNYLNSLNENKKIFDDLAVKNSKLTTEYECSYDKIINLEIQNLKSIVNLVTTITLNIAQLQLQLEEKQKLLEDDKKLKDEKEKIQKEIVEITEQISNSPKHICDRICVNDSDFKTLVETFQAKFPFIENMKFIEQLNSSDSIRLTTQNLKNCLEQTMDRYIKDNTENKKIEEACINPAKNVNEFFFNLNKLIENKNKDILKPLEIYINTIINSGEIDFDLLEKLSKQIVIERVQGINYTADGMKLLIDNLKQIEQQHTIPKIQKRQEEENTRQEKLKISQSKEEYKQELTKILKEIFLIYPNINNTDKQIQLIVSHLFDFDSSDTIKKYIDDYKKVIIIQRMCQKNDILLEKFKDCCKDNITGMYNNRYLVDNILKFFNIREIRNISQNVELYTSNFDKIKAITKHICANNVQETGKQLLMQNNINNIEKYWQKQLETNCDEYTKGATIPNLKAEYNVVLGFFSNLNKLNIINTKINKENNTKANLINQTIQEYINIAIRENEIDLEFIIKMNNVINNNFKTNSFHDTDKLDLLINELNAMKQQHTIPKIQVSQQPVKAIPQKPAPQQIDKQKEDDRIKLAKLELEMKNADEETIFKLFDEYQTNKTIQTFCKNIEQFMNDNKDFKEKLEKDIINGEILFNIDNNNNPIYKLYYKQYMENTSTNNSFKNELDQFMQSKLTNDPIKQHEDKNIVKKYLQDQIKYFSQNYNNYNNKAKCDKIQQTFNSFVSNNPEFAIQFINENSDCSALLTNSKEFINLIEKDERANILLQNENIVRVLMSQNNSVVNSKLQLKSREQIQNIIKDPKFLLRRLNTDYNKKNIKARGENEAYETAITYINIEKNLELRQIKYDCLYNRQAIIEIIIGNDSEKREQLLNILTNDGISHIEIEEGMNYINPYLHYLIRDTDVLNALIASPDIQIPNSDFFAAILGENISFILNPRFEYFSHELELLLRKTMKAKDYYFKTEISSTLYVYMDRMFARNFRGQAQQETNGKLSNWYRIDEKFVSFIEEFALRYSFIDGFTAGFITQTKLEDFLAKRYTIEQAEVRSMKQLPVFMLCNYKDKEEELVKLLTDNQQTLQTLASYTYFIEVFKHSRKFDELLLNKNTMQTLIQTNPADTYLLLDRIQNSTNNEDIYSNNFKENYSQIIYMEPQNRNAILKTAQNIVLDSKNDNLLSKDPANPKAYLGFSNMFQMCLDELYKNDQAELKQFILKASHKQKEQIKIFFTMHPNYKSLGQEIVSSKPIDNYKSVVVAPTTLKIEDVMQQMLNGNYTNSSILIDKMLSRDPEEQQQICQFLLQNITITNELTNNFSFTETLKYTDKYNELFLKPEFMKYIFQTEYKETSISQNIPSLIKSKIGISEHQTSEFVESVLIDNKQKKIYEQIKFQLRDPDNCSKAFKTFNNLFCYFCIQEVKSDEFTSMLFNLKEQDSIDLVKEFFRRYPANIQYIKIEKNQQLRKVVKLNTSYIDIIDSKELAKQMIYSVKTKEAAILFIGNSLNNPIAFEYIKQVFLDPTIAKYPDCHTDNFFITLYTKISLSDNKKDHIDFINLIENGNSQQKTRVTNFYQTNKEDFYKMLLNCEEKIQQNVIGILNINASELQTFKNKSTIIKVNPQNTVTQKSVTKSTELKEKDNLKQEEKLQKSIEELKDLYLINIMSLPVAETQEQKAHFTNKCDGVAQEISGLVQLCPETILLHLDNPNMKNIIEYASKNFKFNFDKFMEENSSLVLENFDKQAIKDYYKNHPDKLENFLQKILASNTQNEGKLNDLIKLQDFINANESINQEIKTKLNDKIKKF